LRRAGRLAQGWIASTKQDLNQIEEAIKLVHDGAREVGRDPYEVRILVRAVVDLCDEDPGPDRRHFHGTVEQLNADFAKLAGQGVTEVFVDMNFSPRVGSPFVDEASGLAEAERVLNALGPLAISGGK
jgi:alkanesulfonate monooxygenase SsuD/methylene tetrahydromethanopterin reductase-like flavin-dependent oxidoreductase (luciferase family)